MTDELEESIVITRVGNGWMVQGLTTVLNGGHNLKEAKVFTSMETLQGFIANHFVELKEIERQASKRTEEPEDANTDSEEEQLDLLSGEGV